jgi:hypothetical protein
LRGFLLLYRSFIAWKMCGKNRLAKPFSRV